MGKDTGALVEVGRLVIRVRGVPSLVEVIEDDIGVGEDKIGVEVVHQVVANGEVDPVLLGREGLAVLGAGDNLELVLGADTAAEEELGGAESTGGENDATALVELDGAAVAAIRQALEFNTGNLATSTNGAADGSVGPQVEVVTAISRNEVGSQRAVSLALGEHEVAVGKGVVLAVGLIVGNHRGPAGFGKAAGENVKAFLTVQLAVDRGVPGTRNTGENALGRSGNVARVPAVREVLVPIQVVGLAMGLALT